MTVRRLSWPVRLMYRFLPGLSESVQLAVAVRGLDVARDRVTAIAQLNCGCCTDLAEKAVLGLDAVFNSLHQVPGDRVQELRELGEEIARGGSR